jgi:hypothetical protein
MNSSTHLVLVFLTATVSVVAQSRFAAASDSVSKGFTYGEFKTGYGITQFFTGLNERFENGNFGTGGGGLSSIAAYRKFKKINHLHLGLKFKAQGAAPSEGDNGEEMFFNFWGVGLSTKYFTLNKASSKGIYLRGDYNFVSQFTQKYTNSQAPEFDHQSALGSAFTLGLGYQYPLKKRYALVPSVEYDWASRQGEVNDIGEVQFRNGNLGFQFGLIF